MKAPTRAKEHHVLVVVCKSGCGELKRRSHRSDALSFQRAHLKEHGKHEVEIVERAAEAKPAKKAKSVSAAKSKKAAAKSKQVAAKKAKPTDEQKAA